MPSCLSSDLPLRLVGGLTTGSIYALIALGYTMVYGVLQLINFAHSEVFMVGTFAGLYTLKAIASGPEGGLVLAGVIGTAMLAAMGASALTALGLERIAYRPLRKRGAPRLSYLISAIGASLFLQNLFFVVGPVGGPAPRPYPNRTVPPTASSLLPFRL